MNDAIHRSTMPPPTDASIFSTMLGVSRSSGSDFLTVAAHKSSRDYRVFPNTHLSQSARAYAQIIFIYNFCARDVSLVLQSNENYSVFFIVYITN